MDTGQVLRYKCGRFLNMRSVVGQPYCPTVIFQLCHGVTIALVSESDTGLHSNWDRRDVGLTARPHLYMSVLRMDNKEL